jgi:hypothetical protein
MWRAFMALGLLGLAACQGAGQAVGAGVMVANIVAAGSVRRAQGNCFNDCVPGTACNKETGLCEALPCRGECREGESCLERGLVHRCVRVKSVELIARDPEPVTTPAAPPEP